MIRAISLLRPFVRGRRSESGATAVEFALVAPVFLLFVLGIVDFGRLFWVKNLMQYGAEQTARYAMVTPTASTADLATYADGEVGNLQGGISWTVGSETLDGVEYRTITASNTFKFLMPLLNSDLPLQAMSRTPINEI